MNAFLSRLCRPQSRRLRAAVTVLTGAAMLSALAATAQHRAPRIVAAPADDAPVAPLAGRDYSMRLDTVRGRVQFFDAKARLAGIVPAAARACEASWAALQPGLWLAVAETDGDGARTLSLQPLGATAPGRRESLSLGTCGEGGVGPALSAAVVARIVERGGGVLFVDDGTPQNAALDPATALARKVP
jgi:hypothetical protein